MHTVYSAAALTDFATTLFSKVGFDHDKAASTAASLVRADMMGHTTHGLALAAWYAEQADAGEVRGSGEPITVRDNGSVLCWDGRRLPGGWLIEQALGLACDRSRQHGVVTVSIGDAFHTGALAAYLPVVAERNLMGIVTCSGPAARAVAPFGGCEPVITPNPFAAVIPTDDTPTIIDISASITTMNQAQQLAAAGLPFPFESAIDEAGHPTCDPTMLQNGRGALLPVGGDTHGHKGFGFGLFIEALTQSLTGRGRQHNPTGTTLNIFIQVLDPNAFGGTAEFTAASTHLALTCRASTPRPGVERVRVPGDRAMAELQRAATDGVALRPAIIATLRDAAERRGLVLPEPLDCYDPADGA